MKRNLFLLIVVSIYLFVACKKNTPAPIPVSNPSIEGNWKMVLVTDSASGITEGKNDTNMTFQPFFMPINPDSGDVTMNIAFDSTNPSTGVIKGHTIRNWFNGLSFEIQGGNIFYTTNHGAWSLSGDPEWGMYFYRGIHAATSYAFDAEQRLLIKSPGKTLFFIRN